MSNQPLLFHIAFFFLKKKTQEQVEHIKENQSDEMNTTPSEDNEENEYYVFHKVIYSIQEFISYNKVSLQYQALLSSIDK
jgi:hypothetical protein